MDPRSALKGVLEKAEEKGWTCMSGAEFEVSFIYVLKDQCFGEKRILRTLRRGLMGSTFNSKKPPVQWKKRNSWV